MCIEECVFQEFEMNNKRMSKSQFVSSLAERSGLSKEQARSALDAMNEMVVQQLKQKESGEITIPSLLKLSVVVKPATHQREGTNPFTKQPMTIRAKPERKIVKARPLKALKDAV
jgi:DNA-binding protein HU-beta